MRFLLLLLSLVLQLNVSGYTNFIPQENHAIKTHTSPKHRLPVTFHRNGEYKVDCPFRFQGQYEDYETGLYYNRFRWYSPDEGIYLSQDPIGLQGNNSTLYTYVSDINSHIDPFGLDELYALITRKDGWYPVFEYGKKAPVGEMFLKKGELWKIGTSKDASKRYTQKYLSQMGVELKVLHTNISRRTTLFLESLKLRGYLAWKGHLPAGNKCCH